MKCERTYRELISHFETFQDRLKYLSLKGVPGELTFGGHRYLNQMLYSSKAWKDLKRKIIIRDNGLDLACEDYPILGPIYLHHLNPITSDDILYERSCVMDPDNLICVSFKTHNLIHYASSEDIDNMMLGGVVERRPNDTCPWLL